MDGIHEIILDNFEDVIHLVDENMNVIFVNKAIEKLSRGRVKKEEMIGKNLYEIFPFLKEDNVDKEYEKVFSEGVVVKTEKWTEYEGMRIFTETKKIPIKENGKVSKVVTIMRDATEIKNMEEALKEIADKYSTIVELAHEGICIDDENERIIYANKAFADMLGYKKDEIIGKNIFDFVDEEGKKIFEEQMKIRREGKASRYEIKKYRKDGKAIVVLISATPVFKEGKYVGSISVNLDITERKKAEEEIKKALEEEKKFKEEVAHYFFNPIAIAKGYLDLIMDELEQDYQKKLGTVKNAVERVENVVKNIVTKGVICE